MTVNAHPKRIRITARIRPIITAWISVFILASAAFGAPALSFFRHTDSRTLNETKPAVPGNMLLVESQEAYLTIAAGNDNAVTVEAQVEVSDDDAEVVRYFLDETRLTLEPVAEGLRLKLSSPFDEINRQKGKMPRTGIFSRFYKGNRYVFKVSFAARITIRIPARQSLVIHNAYGDISVQGITGKHRIINQSGAIQMEACGGDLELQNSYGPVHVPGFKGPVDIKNPSGEVVLKSIEGNARIENSYDAVRFAGITGNLVIQSESAGVEGAGVSGNCEITSSYDRIDVRDVKGSLSISGQSSEVVVDQVGKEVRIENSYNAVRVTRVGMGLQVYGNSSAVTADDIGGATKIRSSYDSITVSKVRGTLDIDASSSAVSARDIQGNTRIVTSYDTVTAAGVGGSLDVRAQSSGVEASDIAGDATIVTSYNPVEARGIGGGLRVDAPSCSVLAEGVTGDVSIKNSYDKVILRGTAGSIEVQGGSSGIEVGDIVALPKGARIDLMTTYDSIDLTLPQNGEYVISVKTNDEISSDFPVYHTDVEGQRLKAELAKGGIPVRLAASSGSIRIKSGRPATVK